MAKVTIGLGAVLVLVGLIGYFGTGRPSWTALIPAFFGIVFLVLGWLALDPGKRKHAMHAAAALGVLGILGSFPGLIGAIRWMGGTTPAWPAAVVSQSITALLLIIFVAMCIWSFIQARKGRQAPVQQP